MYVRDVKLNGRTVRRMRGPQIEIFLLSALEEKTVPAALHFADLHDFVKIVPHVELGVFFVMRQKLANVEHEMSKA